MLFYPALGLGGPYYNSVSSECLFPLGRWPASQNGVNGAVLRLNFLLAELLRTATKNLASELCEQLPQQLLHDHRINPLPMHQANTALNAYQAKSLLFMKADTAGIGAKNAGC